MTAISESHGPARRWMRTAAVAALAVQPLFIGAWLLGGALEPGYSHAADYVSELGASTAATPWVFNGALALLGLSCIALAPALWRVLPRRPASSVAAALLAAFGAQLVLGAIFQVDCPATEQACLDAREAGAVSGEESVHNWIGLLGRLTIVAMPFALAQALNDRPAGPAALIAGFVGAGALAWMLIGYLFAGGERTEVDGLIQRGGFVLVQAWICILAAAVLHETRAAPALPTPTPLRPRDFFASAWTGEGVAYLVPAFLWRRFGQRFRLRRTATWIAEEMWIVRDEAQLASGRIERRERICRFEGEGQIRITADDLPDGVRITLSDAGYAIAPYRALARVGPVLIPVTCRERHALSGDGSLVNTIDIRVLGIPCARIEARARLDADVGETSIEADALRELI